MNILLPLLVLSSLLFSLNKVYAHAPQLHKKESAEKPQCAALEKMDLSKMDAKDPVVQAMMHQCKDWIHEPHNDKKTDKPEHKNQHHG